jgi:hypothetical protein
MDSQKLMVTGAEALESEAGEQVVDEAFADDPPGPDPVELEDEHAARSRAVTPSTTAATSGRGRGRAIAPL